MQEALLDAVAQAQNTSFRIISQQLLRLQAACLFIVQRSDCDGFAPSHTKDPAYARLVQDAEAAGVELIAVACEPCPEGSFKYVGELPINTAWSE